MRGGDIQPSGRDHRGAVGAKAEEKKMKTTRVLLLLELLGVAGERRNWRIRW